MRVLKLAAAALVLLAAGAGVCVWVFFVHPGAVLTSRTAGAAIKRFGEAYSPSWSSLAFEPSVVGPRRHRYALKTENLCLRSADGVISGCFSRLELSVVVRYGRKGPSLELVESFIAVSDSLSVDLRRRTGGAVKPPSAALLTTPVRSLRVELTSSTVTTVTTAVSGSLLAVLAVEGRRPLSLAADLKIRARGSVTRLKADLTADTDLMKGGGPPTFVDLVGRADLGTHGRAKAAFRIRREKGRYAVAGSAEVSASTGPVSAFRLAECAGSAPFAAGGARPASGEVSCRWELASARRLAAPFTVVKGASGRIFLSGGLDGRKYLAALKADLDPITTWGELSGGLEVKAAGDLDRPLKDAKVSHELRALVKVPRFEELVAFLRETKYAVPAPVHVLKGPLTLSVESRGDPMSDQLAATYTFTSDLSGPRQRLILRANGTLTVAGARTPLRTFEHDGVLTLKEVALEVPRLELGRAPKVFKDKRIKTRDEPAAVAPSAGAAASPRPTKPFSFPVRGRLVVKTEKPVLLFSNLAKDPIPVALDLVATFPPADASGVVAARSFAVELFRRNATVDHLNVALTAGSKVGALEGLVLYKTPEVDIRILINGTTEKPRVEFTSVPPLKREEIISMLIFGKSPDELDPEQTASVTNTETALESRAFGLTSLYLFGATPIEHVGYDPATKTTVVRLRLPGGANLSLGSDFDQGRQLTVRKPLAPHWAIESEVTDQAQQGRAAATFLEWFNRY